MKRRLALVLLAISCTVGCDRVTKDWAFESLRLEAPRSYLAGSLRLIYTENSGAFLGLGSTLPPAARFWIFTVGCGVLLAGLLAWALCEKGVGLKTVFAASLVIGGGLGNLLDRGADGEVIDFINVGIGGLRTGIFNVADMAILLGLGTLLIAEKTWRVRARE